MPMIKNYLKIYLVPQKLSSCTKNTVESHKYAVGSKPCRSLTINNRGEQLASWANSEGKCGMKYVCIELHISLQNPSPLDVPLRASASNSILPVASALHR